MSKLSFYLRNLKIYITISYRLLLSERLIIIVTTRATLYVLKPFKNLIRYNNGKSKSNRSNYLLLLILIFSFPSFSSLLSLFLSLSVLDTLFLIILIHQDIIYFNSIDFYNSIDYQDIKDLYYSRYSLANLAPRLAIS